MNKIRVIFYVFMIFNLCAGNLLLAQEKTELDKMPAPVGGIDGILQNVVYPAAAKEAKIQGKVFIKAVINEKGIVESAVVEKSIDNLLDKAALSAVKATKFIPGEKNGKKVKSEVVVPIMFKLK